MYIRTILFAALALCLPAVLHASEEEFLPWSEVRIVSPARKDTGQVIFTAKTAGEKYEDVVIEAFGKRHVLDKEQLEKLSGFPLSSLATTHEAGYERLGGHTVYFKLKTTTYDPSGEIAENRVSIFVSASKGLGISTALRRVIKPAKEEPTK